MEIKDKKQKANYQAVRDFMISVYLKNRIARITEWTVQGAWIEDEEFIPKTTIEYIEDFIEKNYK